MDWLHLLGGIATLSIVVGVTGALAGLLTGVTGEPGTLAATVVVLAVVAGICSLGVAGRANEKTSYW